MQLARIVRGAARHNVICPKLSGGFYFQKCSWHGAVGTKEGSWPKSAVGTVQLAHITGSWPVSAVGIVQLAHIIGSLPICAVGTYYKAHVRTY